MKKLNRKLIPAFAMLLLSAVLMSTASFAWFSSNTKVSATGLKVQATAPAALWISTIGGTKWETSIDLDGDVENMSPVTTNPAQATLANWNSWNFYGLNDAQVTENGTHNVYGDVIADGSVTGADLSKFPAGTQDSADADKALALKLDNTSKFSKGFRLYLEGDATRTMDVAVMAKVTTESEVADEILASMRIAIVAENTTKTVEDDEGNETTVSANNAAVVILQPTAVDTYATVGGNEPNTQSNTEDAPFLVKLTGNVIQNVYVYVWFEGTDGDCINANSINATEWNVALEFVPYTAD